MRKDKAVEQKNFILPDSNENRKVTENELEKAAGGCIAENTRIRMPDGSDRMIQDILPGDQVEGKNGPDCVQDIIRGIDYDMYVISGEKLETLLITSNHPVMTNTGWKSAKELIVDDELQRQSGGTVHIESHYPVNKEMRVYNLILESGHSFYANGYLVGDYQIQGEHMAMMRE